MPSAVLRLAKLGVEPPGSSVPGHHLRRRPRPTGVTADFPHGPGRGVRRTALQSTMQRASLTQQASSGSPGQSGR